MIMHSLVIFIALIGAAVAAAPKPCCTPKQWEGVIELAEAKMIGRGKAAMNTSVIVVASISYDYTNGRIRIDEDVYITGSSSKRTITIIGDFKKAKKVYSIFGGKCHTFSTTSAFPQACIPNNSTFLMGGVLGGTLHYNTFAFIRKDGSLGAILDVSSNNCIPIAALAFEKAKINSKLYSEYFTAIIKNVTAGIKNKSVFNPPKLCKSSIKSQDIIVDFNYLKYFLSRGFTVAQENKMYLDQTVEELFYHYSIQRLHQALLF